MQAKQRSRLAEGEKGVLMAGMLHLGPAISAPVGTL
jgi:hypothetical protein